MRKIEEALKGCFAKAGMEEMTFVLLSRDPAAPAAIYYWIAERIRLSKNSADDPQIREALLCARTMEEEGKKHKPADEIDSDPVVIMNRSKYDHLLSCESQLEDAHNLVRLYKNRLKDYDTSI